MEAIAEQGIYDGGIATTLAQVWFPPAMQPWNQPMISQPDRTSETKLVALNENSLQMEEEDLLICEILPNPGTTSSVFVRSNDKIESLEFYDAQELQIQSFQDVRQDNTIDVSDFTSGLYLLRFKTANDKYQIVKWQKL